MKARVTIAIILLVGLLLGAGCSHHGDLFQLAAQGRTRAVRTLIGSGGAVSGQDRYGRTPLMHAVYFGHADAARLLLDAGADVDAQDRAGSTRCSGPSREGLRQRSVSCCRAAPMPRGATGRDTRRSCTPARWGGGESSICCCGQGRT